MRSNDTPKNGSRPISLLPTEPAPDADEVWPLPSIERLVHSFYDRVQAEPLLGPIFAARIEDWTPHLARMVLFWRAILRSEPGFKPSPRGNPQMLHRGIAELSHAQFDRWLELFTETAHEVFPDPQARHAIVSAQRIATALSQHLPPRN